LSAVLPPQSLYAVGGRVRDEFRASEPPVEAKDLDYVVVGIALDDLTERLRAIGSVNVVGASFAVVKLSTPVGDADVALPRRERSTGPGHRDFAVESGPDVPLADDLGRRDFRMNMIARRIGDDTIVDPFGGVADIVARRIDIVSPRAFVEDPLRMLRAAQFAARFDFGVSEDALAAMTESAPLVATVSPERVHDELTKLLALAARPSVGLEILRATGVLALVWPEILEGVDVDQNEWHAYDVYRHSLATLDAAPPGDLLLRLAALLHDVGKPRTKDGPHFYRHEHVGADMSVAMLERLRFPRDTVTAVEHLVRQHMYSADPELQPKSIRRFVNRIGVDHLERLFALRHADVIGSGLPKRTDENERFEARVAEIVAEHPPFTVRDLAIDGGDVVRLLVARGLAPPMFRGDERVGAILRTLFDEVVDDPQRNERTMLLRRTEELVAAAAAPNPGGPSR